MSQLFGFLRSASTNGRALGVGVVLALGIALFAWVGHGHYPIPDWLFWHYAGYWVAVLVWAAGCVGTGAFLLERVFRLRLPLLEHWLLSFTLGLFAFEWLMFLVGAAGLYRKSTFFLAPILPLAVGQPALTALWLRTRKLLRRRPPRLTPLTGLALAFGLFGLGMVYFLVLTPENIQFDSRWKHMAIAEDWVVHGGLRRPTEGWVFSARPHMTSYLFAWAFLAPKARLFDQMLLCAHLEFFTFLVTTVLGVSALARRLVPGVNPSVAWVARFLFPGIFLYDSSVSGGTDHFGALYAVPIAIFVYRTLRVFEKRNVWVLVCLLAGAVLVKETAALLLVPVPLALLIGRWIAHLVRALREKKPELLRSAWWIPLTALGVGLLVSAPFWLKNLIFFGNPVYPSLGRLFPSEPWSEAAAYKFKWSYQEGQMWAPSRDLDGLLETFRALFTFSFIPNDWHKFHRDVPVFGSLYTLFLPALLFLKGTRRIWLLALWIHVGVFAWYSVHHQDRYLQGLLPLMAGSLAATLWLVWHSFGRVVRGLVCALVALQVVWGGDVYFFETHAMARAPIKKVLDILSSGFTKDFEERFKVQERYQEIGRALPKGARILFHEQNMHLGVNAESVLDKHQWQLGIDYALAGTPEGVRKLLTGLGVTHVYFIPGRSDTIDTLAGDIVFHEFATSYAEKAQRVGGGILFEVAKKPFTKPFRDRVVSLSCGRAPHSGLYALSALAVPPYGPLKDRFDRALRVVAEPEAALQFLSEVDLVVFDKGCDKRPPRQVTAEFEQLFERKGQQIWRRKQLGDRPKPPTRERPGAVPREPPEPEEIHDEPNGP
ncbi:MAG: hypothetical protein M3020_08425 [Myxococcota bacterium]|nr:hypothetical protein [Myxococcota bacterium]